MILRERDIRIAARDHLRKIAMHDADPAWEIGDLGGKQCVGPRFSDQALDDSASPGAGLRLRTRVWQRDPRTRADDIVQPTNPQRVAFTDKQRKPAIF